MIVADSKGLKREISLPISLCLNKREFEMLYLALEQIAERHRKEGTEHYYGWIEIPLLAEVIPSTKPLAWNDPSSIMEHSDASKPE